MAETADGHGGGQGVWDDSCKPWGTRCPEDSVYNDPITGRAALAEACDDDPSCKGIWWIRGEGRGYKCSSIESAHTRSNDNRFCEKESGRPLVAWDSRDELKDYLESRGPMIEMANSTAAFWAELEESEYGHFNVAMVAPKIYDALRLAANVSKKVAKALEVTEVVYAAAASVGLISSEETHEDSVDLKFDEIEQAVEDVHNEVELGMGGIPNSVFNLKGIRISGVKFYQYLNYLDFYFGNFEILDEDDIIKLYQELSKLTHALMGLDQDEPLFDGFLKSLKSTYCGTGPGCKTSKTGLLGQVLALSMRFSEIIAIQIQGINLLGKLLKKYPNKEKGDMYAKRVTCLLGRIRFQLKHLDPMARQEVKSSLAYMFSSDHICYVCMLASYGSREYSTEEKFRHQAAYMEKRVDAYLDLHAAKSMFPREAWWTLARVCTMRSEIVALEAKSKTRPAIRTLSATMESELSELSVNMSLELSAVREQLGFSEERYQGFLAVAEDFAYEDFYMEKVREYRFWDSRKAENEAHESAGQAKNYAGQEKCEELGLKLF